MTNTKLKILDLYSGIGGFSYGLESTGHFETTAFCEIDKHCQKVLKKHWPEVEIFSDVSELKWNPNYTRIDVICGGFPCQDISVAGKQRGFVDEDGKRTRSGLWFQYKRLIEEVKPNWVIIENVRNLLGNGFATVLKNLDEIGYNAEWEVISARDVGSVHLRERIWIVAYPRRREWGPSDRGDKKKLRRRETHEEEVWTSNSPETKRSSDGRQADSEKLEAGIADSDNFRFWPAFASEKEKQQWWTKATSSFRDRWETESSVCRVDDGLSGESYIDRRDGVDRYRIEVIKEMIESGRIIVDSELGVIYSTRIRGREGEKVLLNGSNLKGYVVHGFKYKDEKIPIKAHQIIWLSKNEDVPDDMVIDHINRIKNDNRIENLRLVTFKGNYENQDREHLKISKEDVANILDLYVKGFSIRQTAEMVGYSKSRVHQILKENYTGLDKGRSQRIKQLGNSIVPQIATLIAQRIAYHEGFYGKEDS